jgi:FMN phosphatase YigB (HAD superfamily)
MPLPKSIVFDLGKVLVDFDYGIAGRRIATQAARSFDEVRKAIDGSPLLFEYETGRINRRQFFDFVVAATGFKGTIEEFGDCFADIFFEIPEMIQIHAALRKSGLPTYIFSNTNDLAVSHIRRNFPFFSNFDGYILSYEHGVMKPDAALYEVVEKTSGHRGPDILYLDDRPENIAAGAARRWQVILQESPDKTRKTLTGLGLL